MRAGTDASQDVRRVSTSRGGERADASPLETAWCLQGCEVAGNAGLSLASSLRWIQGRGGGRRRCRAATRLCAGPEKQKATARVAFWNLVPVKRVELPTFALRMRCSTN